MEPKYETLLVGGMKDTEEESSEYILDSMNLKPVIIPEMKREINFLADRRALKKIQNLIREYKPDIVCTHASKAGALGRIAAYNEKVPVIVHTFHGHVFHSYFGKAKTEIYKQAERYLAKKTDIIVAISNRQKYELTEVYKICSPEKVKVIPLGFDLEKFRINRTEKRAKFRNQYRIEEDVIAISIVGRLAPIKNHYFFIQAIKYLKLNSKSKFKAFIVGDGEERGKLMQYCFEQGVGFGTEAADEADLIFTSWIKEIDEVYAGCDIAALTSLNEGTPVSLIEAQASGIPVISTDVGGVRDILDYHETLFKSDDLHGFSQMLNRMVNDSNLRKTLSEKGGHVFSKFHYTRLVSEMDKIYQEVLNRKKTLHN